MSFNIGDYVRYKYENCIYIGKIKFISEVMGFEETLQLDIDTCMEEILKEDIIKSSPNIIDLIEVGDYVNGVEVENIDDEWITMSDTKVPILKSIANGMIKSVITHEQMEQMAYKVGE